MRIAFFIYALTFSSLTTKAQKDGEEISRLLHSANEMSFSSFDQAIKLTDQAEQLINNKGPNQFAQELIRCYQIRILACRYFERLSLLRLYATKNEELVESMRTQLGSSYENAKIDTKISWAQFYYEINDYTKSLTLFSESLAELKRLSQTQQVCEEESLIIEYIATIHNARGEFEAAINQFIASIPYAQCRAAGRKSDFPVRVSLYRNIGRTYLNKGDLEKAKEYLTKAQREFLPYLKKNPAAAASTAITLFEAQAFYYKQRHQFDSALIITEKAMPLVTYSEPFRDRVYHNLGKAYENLNRYPDAEKYYLQELSLLEKKTEQKTLQKTDAYLSLGNVYEKQGKTSQALNYYQRAIVNSIVDFTPMGLENPPLKNILSKRRLFTALQSKYRAQRKLDVTTAGQTCELALALLDSTANEYSLDRDKVILQEQSIQAFEDGINMLYDLFHKTQDQKHLDHCFALIERSKGKVLLENLRMVNQFASVDPSLLENEREIKSELLLVEQSIFKGELAASPPADLPAMRERYADLKHDYANLIQNIKHNAPDYYKLRFDHHVVDLQKIKTELLQPEEALIEFFVGDSTLITIAVTSSKQHITLKKISTEFFEDLHDLRKLLSNPETDLKQLKAKSKEWYTLLLGDVLSKLDDQIRSLIIVPDGALGYIPFEVLIAPDDQYVIEKYSTRYAQSATYLNEQEHVQPKRSS